MPFTFAHPAAVVPLFKNKKLPALALIVGSIIPDFEYFIRMRVVSRYSHTLWGLVLFDLPLALALFFFARKYVCKIFVDNLPGFLNRRLSLYFPLQSKIPFLWVVVAVLLGAVSHIFWDSFTHQNGFFVENLAWLKSSINAWGTQIKVYKLFQHLSTVIGGLVIVFYIYKLPETKNGNSVSVKYWIPIFLVIFAVLIIRYFTGLEFYKLGDWIATFISASIIAIFSVSFFYTKFASH